MRITLYLSKQADLDLYAYFYHVEYRKSTHAKMLLRDYIHRQHIVRIQAPKVTADTWNNVLLPKKITIPIRFGCGDDDLIHYFEDCPNGLRAKCAKSMLRALLAPYMQSAFHYNTVEPYLPYANETVLQPVIQPPADPHGLAYTVQSMQMLMLQMMQMQQGAPMQGMQAMPQEQAPQKPDFMNHRAGWGSPTSAKTTGGAQPENHFLSGLEKEAQKLEDAEVSAGAEKLSGHSFFGMTEAKPTEAGDGGEDEVDGVDDDMVMKLLGVDDY